MNIVGIIPARMGSSRFPGKPLADILGRPMIYHVYCRSKMASSINEVYIATCDQEIKESCLENNMKVVMTSDKHQRASDRAAEAMVKIEQATGKQIDIVVMVQGDEPMVYPEMIEASLEPMLKDESIEIVNLMSKLKTDQEHQDPNEVKVVVDRAGFALYFSREAIPSKKKVVNDVPMLKQVCIIPFRKEFLLKFIDLKPTPLEIIESVDMLRVLEHGYKVKMVFSEYDTYSVDTPLDLDNVKNLMKNDKLMKEYAFSGSS
jgi:3-deoxy-manno-octulosonate cytidylyltransferase (CMP-KDO synthetase)